MTNMILKQSPSLVVVFVLILSAGVSLSQPPAIECRFDDKIIPNWNNSNTNCEGGQWGGFLQDNCCEEAFSGYLYLLSERANISGQIYLPANEQRSCLNSLHRVGKDILQCEFERLTRGGGGCSDFSVSDVVNTFNTELQSLEENCRTLGHDGDEVHACGNCLKRWKEIEASIRNKRSLKGEVDFCRFAILVSLTSQRIQDKNGIRSVYKCLGEEKAVVQGGIDGKKKMSTGLAVVGGGLTGVAMIAILAAWILLKRRIHSDFKTGKDVSEDELPDELDCQKIPLKEIRSATDNLDVVNFIGQGIAGKVYKGVLWNGVHVAVKHIISDDGHMETFVREVRSLSHVKHPNLVALLGHCEEKHECFLVYELCPNGNLSEWLFGKEKMLSWIQRLEIAIDCARGLWFLHTFPEGCIVHRDIKPTNILLGTCFEAKLSDFGLSKVIDLGKSYVSSEVRGTFGYVDPEYHQNRRVNSYGDVYSFGIVLLQLLSGRRVINLDAKKPMSLDKMAKFLTKGGKVTEFADPRLNAEYSTEAFDVILKLALSCTTHKHLRPTMEKVVKGLETAHDMSIKETGSAPFGSPTRV